MTVRVLLVDDHPVVLEGLRAMLRAETDIEVVGACDSGPEAVGQVGTLRPDVVLMDLRMPGVDGIEATARITAVHGCRVLVLTTYDNSGDILRAVEAGAAGYLLKDTPRRELAEAVRAAARGETVLRGPIAAKLATAVRDPSAQALSPREVEVLQCVADGLSNAETGRRLFISETTVKTHLLRIFEKLGVGDRTAAVTSAIARGMLPPPG